MPPNLSVYNLLVEPWLPLRRQSGATQWGSPAALVSQLHEDPVVDFAWLRPDFNTASHELLIGLLSAAMRPADEAEWQTHWHSPPEPAALARALVPMNGKFDLIGPKNRFLQDYDAIERDDYDEANVNVRTAIRLLMNAPGNNTLLHNKDFFDQAAFPRHQSGELVFSLPAAAIALYTLQAHVSAIGGGYKTSMRGGGPVVTRVQAAAESHREPVLWEKLWAHVETQKQWSDRGPVIEGDDAAIWPWLAPTQIEEIGNEDVHPLHVYWGMPQRIRLRFESGRGRACHLTGRTDEWVVAEYCTIPHGNDYPSDQFVHPLTPYYVAAGNKCLPDHVHDQEFAYPVWAQCCFAKPKHHPALAVQHWAGRAAGRDAVREHGFERFALTMSGYDMNKAKACSWAEHTAPLWVFSQPERQQEFEALALDCVAAAKKAGAWLQWAVRVGWGRGDSSQIQKDKTDYSFISAPVFAATEGDFFALLERAAPLIVTGDANRLIEVRRQWVATLQEAVMRAFDRRVPWDPSDSSANYAKALFYLSVRLRGFGEDGKKWLAAALGQTAEQLAGQTAGNGNGQEIGMQNDAVEALVRLVVQWWRELNAPKRKRGAMANKAALQIRRIRRAPTLFEIQQQPAVLDLITRCQGVDRADMDQLAQIAGVLAGVREHRKGATVAKAVGQGGLEAKRSSQLSESGLRNLLQTPAADLLDPMRELVRRAGGVVNVYDLVGSMLRWDEELIRKAWLLDFYGVYHACMPMTAEGRAARRRIENDANEELEGEMDHA